jgi:hypothetical protein
MFRDVVILIRTRLITEASAHDDVAGASVAHIQPHTGVQQLEVA